MSENSIGLCRLPMVVLEPTAQAVPSFDGSLASRRHPVNQHVPDALVSAFVVIVSRVFDDRSDERFSSEKDLLIKALRRVAMSMTNNVKYLTSPRPVHTSVVKKSAAAIRWACALTNVLQLMGRSGEGLIPCSFNTLAIVLRATR